MEDNNVFYNGSDEEEKDSSIIDEDDHVEEERARKYDTKEQEGRFSYSEINDYLLSQKYPAGFTKADKLALRKRAKFFKIKDGQLYYTGRGK